TTALRTLPEVRAWANPQRSACCAENVRGDTTPHRVAGVAKGIRSADEVGSDHGAEPVRADEERSGFLAAIGEPRHHCVRAAGVAHAADSRPNRVAAESVEQHLDQLAAEQRDSGAAEPFPHPLARYVVQEPAGGGAYLVAFGRAADDENLLPEIQLR